MDLFNFLAEKDLFAEIYRNQLAKRLLEELSASNEAERGMVSKLKMRCGAQFTSKMEGMLNDLNQATEHNRNFDEWCTENDKKIPPGNNGGGSNSVAAQTKIGLEFGVSVLATGYWPTYTATEINLPKSMSICLSTFEDYYGQKTQHRKVFPKFYCPLTTVFASIPFTIPLARVLHPPFGGCHPPTTSCVSSSPIAGSLCLSTPCNNSCFPQPRRVEVVVLIAT